MLILVRLIGILIAVFGIALVLSPKTFKKVMTYFKEGNRIYWAGIIRIVFGGILLIASPHCRWTAFIVIVGILFLLAGGVIFVLGLKKSKDILDICEKKLGAMMPLAGLIPVTLGILIIFAA
ncbi:MAG: hypothetical protein PHW62_07630 [Candidatus Ratteibacteria bacterium]|nr:hypothetical protein [Candidatus Ratteibacteria bacterium]